MQPELDTDKLVFLDESSVNCGMTRLYGRAATNERVYDYVPDVRFERTSIISTISLKRDSAPLIFKGTLNGNVFKAYVKECLTPTLNKGDILVLDNLSVHRVKRALEPLISKGVKILWLPRYSPDFNPIELSWSKMKSKIRELKPRNYDELKNAIKLALDSFTDLDIIHWFEHDGYRLNI